MVPVNSGAPHRRDEAGDHPEQKPAGQFSIAVSGRLRHGALWEAVGRLGSVRALARVLEVSYATACRWVNMQEVPGAARMTDAKFIERCLKLTGQFPEDLFPEALKSRVTGKAFAFTVRKDVDLRLLEANSLKALPEGDPEANLERREIREMIEAGAGLTDKEITTLKMRFGFGGDEATLDETAAAMGVTRERARQIESNALRKLYNSKVVRQWMP